MNWNYFVRIRNLNIKSFFKKKNISEKCDIIKYLNNNNFTFLEEDLNNIYDIIKPKENKHEIIERKIETKDLEPERSIQPVLPYQKKRVRNDSKTKRIINVSGSVDTQRNN